MEGVLHARTSFTASHSEREGTTPEMHLVELVTCSIFFKIPIYMPQPLRILVMNAGAASPGMNTAVRALGKILGLCDVCFSVSVVHVSTCLSVQYDWGSRAAIRCSPRRTASWVRRRHAEQESSARCCVCALFAGVDSERRRTGQRRRARAEMDERERLGGRWRLEPGLQPPHCRREYLCCPAVFFFFFVVYIQVVWAVLTCSDVELISSTLQNNGIEALVLIGGMEGYSSVRTLLTLADKYPGLRLPMVRFTRVSLEFGSLALQVVCRQLVV